MIDGSETPHVRSSALTASSNSLISTHERRTLLIQRHRVPTARDPHAQRDERLADPQQGQYRERQRRPMHERARLLLGKDCPEVPGDREARGEVALGGGEGVGGCGGLEEEEGEEDEDFGPDAGVVGEGVDAEGGEGGEDDEDGGPAVVEGEGEVHEDLVGGRAGLVILFDDVVDVGYGGGDEEGKDEC